MLNARVQLTKQSSMLVFDLNLTGFINAQCDRCGDDFELPLNTHGQLLVKFGDEAREVDVDVFIIPATETHFNIAQQLYEYICVTKPLHIVHPDDKNGNSTCNPVFLKKLKDINNHPENRKEKNGDPRWDALKNLKL